MVPKRSIEWRHWGDHRSLKAIAVLDRYQVPHTLDFFLIIASKTISAGIYFRKAYHQIPVAPDDVPRTAVTKLFRFYELLRMSCGLQNAAQTM